MTTDLIQYLSDAISRAEQGAVASPSGSWLAGMFGRSANLFEKELRSHVARFLLACNLKYPADLQPAVKGQTRYEKLTLGQLFAVIREASNRRPDIAPPWIPRDWTLTRFLAEAHQVNDAWVSTKHGNEVQPQVLLERMRTMLTLAQLLREARGGDV